MYSSGALFIASTNCAYLPIKPHQLRATAGENEATWCDNALLVRGVERQGFLEESSTFLRQESDITL
jgi:hypothetical protein